MLFRYYFSRYIYKIDKGMRINNHVSFVFDMIDFRIFII